MVSILESQNKDLLILSFVLTISRERTTWELVVGLYIHYAEMSSVSQNTLPFFFF